MNRKNKTASAGCRLLMFLLLLPLLLAAGCTKGGGNEEVIPPKATDPTAEGKDTTGAVRPEDLPPIYGSNIDSQIRLRVSDARGRDLLNPNSRSKKAVDASKIKLYYVKDGKEKLYYRGNYDVPTGVELLTPEGMQSAYYALRVFLDCESEENVTTTILEWPDGRRDVFKAEFYRNSEKAYIVLVQKVWLNDKLIWDRMKNSRWEPYQITR